MPLIHPTLKTAGVAAALVVLAILWFSVIRTLTHPPPPYPRTTAPNAIVWGNRVFESPSFLKEWLRSHGARYSFWAHRHPAGRLILDPQHVRRHPSRPLRASAKSLKRPSRPIALSARPFVHLHMPSLDLSTLHRRVTAAPARARAAASTLEVGRTRSSLSITEGVFLALVSLLVALGLIPRRVLMARVPGHDKWIGDMKIVAFGLAIAIGTGGLVAGIL